MMERGFISQKIKELQIKKYLESKLSNVGLSEIRLKKIPLGEKIIISTSRPSLIVGSKGSNIKDLTKFLKKEFKLENPQIEINEIKNIFLDANVVAEKIAFSLERFGSSRFKGIGHKMMENVIKAGALGVEIIISGKIPGARAKSWRFYQGYLKKCGDASLVGVRRAKKIANLKSGIVGIKVSIMPPDIKLPDKIEILEEAELVMEEMKEEKPGKKKEAKETKEKEPKKEAKKKGKPKAEEKKEETKEEPKPSNESEKGLENSKSSQRDEEKIPSAEELIKATKEKFKDEEVKVRDPKKMTAEELIEKAKLLSENEKSLGKPKATQKKESP